jgi:hypothetical protein
LLKLLIKYYLSYQIKEDKIGWSYSTCPGDEKCVQDLVEKFGRKENTRKTKR